MFISACLWLNFWISVLQLWISKKSVMTHVRCALIRWKLKAVNNLNRMWQGLEPFKETAFVMIEVCSCFDKSNTTSVVFGELCGILHGAAIHLWEANHLVASKVNLEDKHSGNILEILKCLKDTSQDIYIQWLQIQRTVPCHTHRDLLCRLWLHLCKLALPWHYLWVTYIQEVSFYHQIWWHRGVPLNLAKVIQQWIPKGVAILQRPHLHEKLISKP